MVSFPKPLMPGAIIAVTAPSSGVSGAATARLDLVLDQLRQRGYRVIEGKCLRAQHKDASAPVLERASELNRFLSDPDVAAVLPPWGGELASEVLEFIDYEGLRSLEPKWVLAYSDSSTWMLPLTLISGWATAHGSTLLDFAPTQTDALTTAALTLLERGLSTPFEQSSSERYQTTWTDFATRVDAPFNLTEKTEWKRLDGSQDEVTVEGRLIGGCFDTLVGLAGTKFGDIPRFARASSSRGTVLFLENAEMSPTGVVRALLSLKRQGWFSHLSGLLLGRSAGPNAASSNSLSYEEALRAVLSDLSFPVLYDMDIGHKPPQLTLVNGAKAVIKFAAGRGSVIQTEA